ncbi:TPA: hypothetical protein JAN03_23840 [Citrobacter freundii]|nr:hypothetical protein [Citrobacter freundii]
MHVIEDTPALQVTSLSALKEQLLKLNENDYPFILEVDGNDIVASWNIIDAKWLKLLNQAGLKKQFELRLIFNDARKTVKYIGKSSEPSINGFKFKKTVRYGRYPNSEVGVSWAAKEDGSIGDTYRYSFNENKITAPVFNVVKNAGWNINSSLLDKKGCWIAVFLTALLIAVIVSIVPGVFIFSSLIVIKNAARAEVDLLRSGRNEMAYQGSSFELRSQISLPEFKLAVRSERFSDIKD